MVEVKCQQYIGHAISHHILNDWSMLSNHYKGLGSLLLLLSTARGCSCLALYGLAVYDNVSGKQQWGWETAYR
jgi:hypothetical protein